MFKPWELRGHQANDYWNKKFLEMQERLRMGQIIDLDKKISEEEEIERFDKEDSQFWNFKHEMYSDSDGDLVRFKNKPTGQPKLFQGNPYGPGGHFIPCDSYPIKADPSSKNSGLIMNFGEALVECIDQEEEVVDTEDVNLLHIHGLIISIPIAIRLRPLLQMSDQR